MLPGSRTVKPDIKLIEPGDLFVALFGLNEIRVYSTAQTGWKDVLTITDRLKRPDSMAVSSPYDDLYVANLDAHNVTVYDGELGQYYRTIAAGITDPTDLAVSANADLAVVNKSKNRVLYYQGGRLVRTIEKLRMPLAAVFDSKGNLYVADYLNDRVLEYGFRTVKVVRTIKLGIKGPSALAFDDSGRLFVANVRGDTVTAYDANSDTPVLTVSQGLSAPIALAILRSEKLYVLNFGTHDVLAYNLKTKQSTTITDGLEKPQALVIEPPDDLAVAGSSGVTIYGADDKLVHRISGEAVNLAVAP